MVMEISPAPLPSPRRRCFEWGLAWSWVRGIYNTFRNIPNPSVHQAFCLLILDEGGKRQNPWSLTQSTHKLCCVKKERKFASVTPGFPNLLLIGGIFPPPFFFFLLRNNSIELFCFNWFCSLKLKHPRLLPECHYLRVRCWLGSLEFTWIQLRM